MSYLKSFVFVILSLLFINTAFAGDGITYPTGGTITKGIFTIQASASGDIEFVRFYLHGDDSTSGVNKWLNDGFWYYQDDYSYPYGATWNMVGIPNTRYTTMIWIKYKNGEINKEPGGRVSFNAYPNEWRVTSEWGDCYPSCGNGQQTRTVKCFNADNTELTQNPEKDCYNENVPIPETTQDCYTYCPTYSWEPDYWTSCNAPENCGVGSQELIYKCVDDNNNKVSSSYCSGTPQSKTKSCNEDSGCIYEWKYGSWGNCSETCGSGTKTRNAYCRDQFGNTVSNYNCQGTSLTTETCTETYGCKQPVATIDSISPPTAKISEIVSFSGYGNDPDGGSISAYEWRSSIDGQLSTQSSFSTSNLSAGNHTIFFKVQDDEGNWSTSVEYEITILQEQCPYPEAALTTNIQTGELPLEVQFTDQSVATQNKSIISWEWDFGDGSESFEQNPVHIYNIAGTYTVTLKVKNNCGAQDIVTKTNLVVVKETSKDINLAVPFIAQSPPGDWDNTRNCGPTSYLMIYTYYKNTIPTVQDIKNLDDWLFENEELPINNYNGSYTTCDILKRLSINHGGFSETEVHRDWTMEGLIAELQKGYPVIVAVRLRMSSKITTSNGHFMVLRGIDQNYVYVNDPGRSLESEHGKNKKYSKQEFLASWNTQGRACVTIHSEFSGGGSSDQPLNLASELAQNKIVLGWDHPDSELPLSYQILRNGNYIDSVESNNTYYTDTSVEAGVIYCYTVKSEFEENLSGPSNEICIELSNDSDEIDLENGLVAYYPFNGNANDESGNGNHGINQGPNLVTDRFNQENKAYEFEGINDHITYQFSNEQMDNFTVVFWLNPFSSVKYNQNIFANNGWGSFHFHTDPNGGIYVGTDAESRFTPSDLPNGTLAMNQWQLFTYTFNNGIAKFYRNANLLAKRTHQVSENWNTFNIGNIQDDDRHTVHGVIDDVRLYNRALSEKEIAAIYHYKLPIIAVKENAYAIPSTNGTISFNYEYTGTEQLVIQSTSDWLTVSSNNDIITVAYNPNEGNERTSLITIIAVGTNISQTVSIIQETNEINLDKGLIAYYPFNGNANDESGNENHGTVYGAGLIEDRFGNKDSAYKFEEENDNILIDQSYNICFSKGFTFFTWIKPNNSEKVWKTIFSKWTGNNLDESFWIGLYDNTIAIEIVTTILAHPDNWRQTDKIIQNDAWQSLAVTYNNNDHQINIYINDNKVLNWSDIKGEYITNCNYPIIIGALERETIGHGNPGILDDIRIYNRSLSEDEIIAFYEMQSNKFSVDPTFQEVPATSGTTTFEVKSNFNWAATTNDSWLTIQTNNNIITINYEENIIGEARTGKITVTAEGASNSLLILEVIQESGIIDLESGLVAYYPFDGNANDGSGNGYDCITVGEAIYDNGILDKAFLFNGSTYLKINENPFTNNDEMTISMWIKIDKLKNAKLIIKDGIQYSRDFQLSMVSEGNLRFISHVFSKGWDIDFRTENILNINEWNHVVYKFNSKIGGSLYVNGIICGKDDPFETQLSFGEFPVEIGGTSHMDRFFEGKIDDIRFYNRAINEAEIKALYETKAIDLENGLVAYYPFNGNANDESGNENHGNIYGAKLTENHFNLLNSAYQFDGNDDYILIKNREYLNFSKDTGFSIGLWLKKDTLSRSRLIQKRNGEKNFFSLSISDSTGKISFSLANNWQQESSHYYVLNSNKDVVDNAWHFVVVIRDVLNNQTKIYIDGILDTFGEGFNYDLTNSADINIARYYTGTGSYYKGEIDDIRIYKRVLSDIEIKSLYEFSPDIFLTPMSKVIPSSTGSTMFTITSNMSWTASTNASWLLLQTTNNTIIANYEENTGEERIAQIFVDSDNNINNQKVIQVRQESGEIDLENGLVAFYPFNGNANDESGNGNHGLVRGAQLVKDKFGNQRNAYHFDGIDDFIEVSDNESFDIDNLTIAVWINPNDFPDINYSGIICKAGQTKQTSFCTSSTTNSLRFSAYFEDATNNQPGIKEEVDLNIWQHITFVLKNGEVSIYKNSDLILEDNSSKGKVLNKNDEPLYIGRTYWFPSNQLSINYFSGIIDDIRIYNRALTKLEINELYKFQQSNLSIDPNTKNIASSSGTTSFTITSNVNWNATTTASWLTIQSGQNTITAIYDENPGEIRTAIITVSPEGSSLSPQYIEITQNQKPNHSPISNNKKITTNTNIPIDISLSATDIDNDPLIFSILQPPSHGTISNEPPNIIYTPDQNYEGTDEFTFKTNDGKEDSKIATVSIQINPIITTRHFKEVDGNPADDTWTIYLSSATLDGENLQPNDEVAIFDNETLVGSLKISEVLSNANQLKNYLTAWSTLSDKNGYQAGQPYTFKCWDISQQKEFTSFNPVLTNPYDDAFTGDVFPDGDGKYSIVSLNFLTSIKQTIELSKGYQFVSLNVQPDESEMTEILSSSLNEIDFAKDSKGNMLRKIGPNWVNNIGNWKNTEGYLLRMTNNAILNVEGMPISPETPINLNSGYQFVAYLLIEPIDALTAFSDILDHLDFAKDSYGNMIRKIGPNWVNNIGDLNPGEGYLLKMNAEDRLFYEKPVRIQRKSCQIKDTTETISHFGDISGNPADETWTIYLAQAQINETHLEAKDEIAIFDGDTLVGVFQLTEQLTEEKQNNHYITAWATLNDGNGYTAGNTFTFKCWDASAGVEYSTYELTLLNPYNDGYTNTIFPEDDGNYSISKIVFLDKQHKTGDMNDDGIIDLKDALWILKMLVGME